MMSILIRHQCNDKTALECDEHFHPIREVPWNTKIETLPNANYVNTPYGFMGARSSFEGPLFFINADEYLFTDKTWNIALEKGETKNRVTFYKNDIQQFSFEYEKVELPAWDSWADDKTEDFFIWLTHYRNDDWIIRNLTKDPRESIKV